MGRTVGINILAFSLVFLAAGFFGRQVFAADSSVTNDVSVSVSSGGNVTTGGTVSGGKTNANVKVKTVINGVEVENFDQNFSGDVDFEKSFEFSTAGGKSSTTVKVQSQGTTSRGASEKALLLKRSVDRDEVKIKDFASSTRNLVNELEVRATTSAEFSSASSSPHYPSFAADFTKSLRGFFKNVFSIFHF